LESRKIVGASCMERGKKGSSPVKLVFWGKGGEVGREKSHFPSAQTSRRGKRKEKKISSTLSGEGRWGGHLTDMAGNIKGELSVEILEREVEEGLKKREEKGLENIWFMDFLA